MNPIKDIQKLILRSAVSFIVFCGLSNTVFSQLDTKHYIPPMYGKEDLGTHYLVLGTPIQNTFNVTVTDGAGNLITTIPISNSASSTYTLGSENDSPFTVPYTQLNTPVSNNKGLILSADEPFYASVRVKVSAQAGSLTSKGAKAALGTDFRTGHMFNNTGYIDGKSNCFSFMATENGTTVNVTDINPGVIFVSSTTSGSPETSVDMQFTLNAGESVVVAAHMNHSLATNNTNGLNGTHITSDKPIAVNCGSWLAGNCIDGTNSAGPSCSGRDIGIDQIVSKENIGDEYVLIKGFGVDNERVTVIAAQDNTQIFLNGSASPSTTLNAGDVYYIEGTAFSGNDNLYLNASGPVYVTQTLNGGDGNADDTERQAGINFLPPVKCTGAQEVTIPNVDFIGTAYVSIVADAGANVQVNGSSLGSGNSVTGTSEYVTYQVSGYSGDVTVTSDKLIRVALLNLNGNIGAAGYFSGFSKDINLSASYVNNGTNTNEEIAEGCGLATITIERSSLNANVAETILLDVQGTAIEGTDFSDIPDQLTFNPGETIISFQVEAFEDLITEGDEDVVITMMVDGDLCGTDELEFIIKDVEELNVSVDDSNVLCPGDDISLLATVTGGAEPFEYLWSTGETSESINVSPNVTQTYTVSVIDVCKVDTVSASSIVTVPLYELEIFHTNDTSVLCPYTDLVLAAEASGGLAAYDYQWWVDGEYILNGPLLLTDPVVTTTYTIIVTDQCGLETTEYVTIDVQTPLMELNVSESQICPYDSIEIWVSVLGGLPPFEYYWEHSGETDQYIDVAPGWSTTYEVTVMDACQTYNVKGYPIVEVIKPHADFSILSSTQMENLPVFFANNSIGGSSWDWDLGNGDTSTDFAPGTTYTEDGTYIVTLIAMNDMGCTDTAVKEIRIKPEFYFYAPNTFTPNGDAFNNFYSVSVIGALEFSFDIFDRWGERIYSSTDPYFQWSGDYNSGIVPDGAYIYKCRILNENLEVMEFLGHINVLK